jgi:ABC-type branched-subunit amino acid transport system substrate-binding protein
MLRTHLRATALAVVFVATAFAQGVSDQEVVVGQSAVLTGPASFLGTAMKAGLEAAFAQANAAGGVHGRKIRLVSLDDKYEPAPCAENTKNLIEKEKVFALVGYVGTPTCNAAKPVFEGAGVPFIGPFTGAATLRKDVKWIFNYRASYEQETAEIVRGLVKERGVKDVGILYQNDAYGGTIRAGVTKALAELGLKPACEGSYERNTLDVDAAVEKFVSGKPQAVVLGGAYAPCAEFVRRCKAKNYDPIFTSVSFVGPEKFVENLGPAGEGEIVTQVVPPPTDASLSGAKEFLAAMEAVGKAKEVNHVSFEGYLTGRLFLAGLRAAGPKPERSGLSAALENLTDAELGIGFPVGFKDRGRQASDRVFKTVIKDGKLVPFTVWSEIK